MIVSLLPDLIVPSRINQICRYNGADSLPLCRDKKHFCEYPYEIDYRYNSRGFRDHEWPSDGRALRESIWCVGDSFTVGIGQPFDHIWPQILSAGSDQRSVNVSMDGASNDWIARRARDIIDAVRPHRMVIMWSYLHRRESHDLTLDDEQRRLHHIKRRHPFLASHDSTETQDLQNFQSCRDLITGLGIDVIEFAVPDYKFHQIDMSGLSIGLDEIAHTWQEIRGVDWPLAPPDSLEHLLCLGYDIIRELRDLHQCYQRWHDILWLADQRKNWNIPGVTQVIRQDLARDGHHFGIETSHAIVRQISHHFGFDVRR